jgi:uncharacterized membrane protein (UPF0127 family)
VRTAWLLCEGTVLASLEVAESLTERTKGLLGRSGYEGAMLFPRTRAIHSLGMRFALDVAFLDGDLVVIDSLRLAPTRVARPRRRTRNVLEAQAGSFARWGLEAGQRLEIRETA